MKKILLGLIGLLFAIPGWAVDLPAGYTELEYIESTGTQYIDTGVPLDAADKMTGKIAFTRLNSLSYIAGARGSNSKAIGYILYASLHQGLTIYNSAWPEQGINISADEIVEFETVMGTTAQSFSVNGRSVISSDAVNISSFLNTNTITLFGLRTEYMSSAKIYSIKIYRDSTLKRDFVPAKNSSGVIGMYDTVNNEFYTNQGTGEFTAGPVVGIRIATTAYNSARFSPVMTELNDTIATIRSVVTNTINQTKAIADLQATKQTRPDETCPAGKKCLLVEDNDGTPHWYEIVESPEVQ